MKPRAGVYGMPFDRVGGGQLHQAILADVLASSHRVDLIHHHEGLGHDDLVRQYDLDLGRVDLRYVEPLATVWPYGSEGGRFSGEPFDAHRALTEPYDLFVNVVVAPPIRSYARRSALIVLFPFVGRDDVWPWSSRDRPPFPKRIVRNAYYAFRWRRVFASYGPCVANSAFTAAWVKKRWGRDAEVVYPPVRARFTARPKRRLILSVGRFSRRGTRKKQLDMVRAFARARGSGLMEGWEYLLVGGVADNARDRRYFDEVAEAAEGHPVRLIANAPDEVVKEAYERAAVFWHAAGYGEDERLHPERTEHFGMSTVEAMAAGCVPVAIRKGGQPEIVEHGTSGFLWDTMEELVGHTRELVDSPRLREEMARAARERARVFTDPDAFAARMETVLGL